MGHLKIRCGGCGSDWVVYHRDDWKDWKARTCPMCGKSIPSGLWERQILRAFGEMEDTARELVNEHTGNHGTLFTVDYIADVVFPNDDGGISDQIGELREEIDEIGDEIDEIRGMLTLFFTKGEDEDE